MAKSAAQIKADMAVGNLHDRVGDIVDHLVERDQQRQGNLVMCIGSSILAQGLVSTSARFAYDAAGPCEWARVLTNQRFMFRNAAVSGQFTEQMLQRLRMIFNVDGTKSGTGTIKVALPQLRRVNADYLPPIFDRIINGQDNKVFGV